MEPFYRQPLEVSSSDYEGTFVLSGEMLTSVSWTHSDSGLQCCAQNYLESNYRLLKRTQNQQGSAEVYSYLDNCFVLWNLNYSYPAPGYVADG